MTGRHPGPDTRADLARRIKRDRPHVSYAEIGRLTGMTREGARLACIRLSRGDAQTARHIAPPGVTEVGATIDTAAAQLAELPPQWRAIVTSQAASLFATIHARAVAELDRGRVQSRGKATERKSIVVDGSAEP